MPSVLLTGFEPFGGSRINPSAEAIQRLAAEGPSGFQLHSRILPVDASRAPAVIREALLSLRPDWCLMLGQAEGRATISIERIAVNLCDFRIPDNTGSQPIDQSIVSDGPAAYFATLPVRAMLDSLHAAEVPGDLSLSAGAYLCNLVFYVALHMSHVHRLPTRCGFVHLPLLTTQVPEVRKPAPSMSLDTICAGIRAMIGALECETSIAVAR